MNTDWGSTEFWSYWPTDPEANTSNTTALNGFVGAWQSDSGSSYQPLYGHIQYSWTSPAGRGSKPPSWGWLMWLMAGPAALGVSAWKYAHLSHSHVRSASRFTLNAPAVQLQHPQLHTRICKCHSTWTLNDWAHTFKAADTILVFINSGINKGRKPFNVWSGAMSVVPSLPAGNDGSVNTSALPVELFILNWGPFCLGRTPDCFRWSNYCEKPDLQEEKVDITTH